MLASARARAGPRRSARRAGVAARRSAGDHGRRPVARARARAARGGSRRRRIGIDPLDLGRRDARPARRSGARCRRSRRASSPWRTSSPSAVDTVGRRAPTSWPSMRCESVIGTATPPAVMRPQRSARCQKRASSRRSTRLSCEIACVTASRSGALVDAVDDRGADLGIAARARRRSGGRAARTGCAGARSSGSSAAAASSRRAIVPRSHDVAGAEQLGADRVRHEHLARDHAVEHQQADVLGAGPGQPLDVPGPGLERPDRHAQLALRPPSRSSGSSCPRSGSSSSSGVACRSIDDAPGLRVTERTLSYAGAHDRRVSSRTVGTEVALVRRLTGQGPEHGDVRRRGQRSRRPQRCVTCPPSGPR